MSNRNKTTHTAPRWTYVLVGWLVGVFVYAPALEYETLVLLDA